MGKPYSKKEIAAIQKAESSIEAIEFVKKINPDRSNRGIEQKYYFLKRDENIVPVDDHGLEEEEVIVITVGDITVEVPVHVRSIEIEGKKFSW